MYSDCLPLAGDSRIWGHMCPYDVCQVQPFESVLCLVFVTGGGNVTCHIQSCQLHSPEPLTGPLEFSWVTEGRRGTSPRRCLTGLSLLRHLCLVSSTLGAASLVAVVPTCKAQVPCQSPGGRTSAATAPLSPELCCGLSWTSCGRDGEMPACMVTLLPLL